MADKRRFLPERAHQLAKPTFPTPIPDRHFVRRTGTVYSRRRGGSPAIGGEDVYCGAKSALRFLPSSQGGLFPLHGSGDAVRCVYRRLYHTGRAAFRYELGFVPVSSPPTIAIEVARSLAAIPVRTIEDAEPLGLSQVGSSLSQHYLLSTTKMKNGQPHSVEDWWCDSCAGMVLLEHATDESLHLSGYQSSIGDLEDQGILLRHARLEGSGNITSLWLLGYGPTADLRRVRQVRMHLTRVHTEFQCFRSIVNAARTDPLRHEMDIESQSLERYLGALSKVLDKDRRYGTPQKEILRTTLAIAGDAEPGALTSVLESASSLKAELVTKRRQIMSDKYVAQSWEKIVAYAVGIGIVATILFLVVRNEPFQDPNLVVLIRTLLSFATAVLGAIIPGFLRVSWKGRGWMIRAGGAMALFVLTFLMTPRVLDV